MRSHVFETCRGPVRGVVSQASVIQPRMIDPIALPEWPRPGGRRLNRRTPWLSPGGGRHGRSRQDHPGDRGSAPGASCSAGSTRTRLTARRGTGACEGSVMSRLDPVGTYLDPIVGWRCWRVLSMQTLSEGRRYRLCAAGTFGVPKVWEPRVAVVAQCSSFKSRHEAPHPSHECGLYAYESREEAERKFAVMWDGNARSGTTWAFGRTSLWGRVIECELGWRLHSTPTPTRSRSSPTAKRAQRSLTSTRSMSSNVHSPSCGRCFVATGLKSSERLVQDVHLRNHGQELPQALPRRGLRDAERAS